MSKSRWEYIYGINPVFEVVRGGKRTIHQAYLNENALAQSRMKKLARFLEGKQVPVEQVPKGRLFDLAQNKDHQGAVLKVSPYPYTPLASVLERKRLLMVDNVEDPHNVGAVIRCADVFGYTAVLLPVKGTPEIYPSVVKISAGATEHLDIVKESSAVSYMNKAVAHGYQVVALDMKGSVDVRELSFTASEKILLVIGGEAKAVGRYILNNADYVVRIEQQGKINSLNASVAAGITMFTLNVAPV